MANVLYYLASGSRDPTELDKLAFALNVEGHGVTYCGKGKELESIVDAVYCTRPKNIMLEDKNGKYTQRLFAYDFLIYDLRDSSNVEELLEIDLTDMVHISTDFPVLLIHKDFLPQHVENTIRDSYIHSKFGDPSHPEIINLINNLKLNY